MDINEMENLIKIEIDQLIQTDYFNVEIIKKIKESYHNEYQKLKSTSDVLLRHIYRKSKKENFFFFDCPFEVYINHYNPRKTKFLENNIDAEEIHFVQQEMDHLNQPVKHKMIEIKYRHINKYLVNNGNEALDFSKFKDPNYSYNSVIYFNEKSVSINYSKLIISNNTWQYSYKRKREFLDNRLKEIKKDKKLNPVKKKSVAKAKQLTTNQAVILLDRLGVFNTIDTSNKSKRDKIISLLIGRNAKNIGIAIGKLDNSPKENGENYQKDIKKINLLLTNL